MSLREFLVFWCRITAIVAAPLILFSELLRPRSLRPIGVLAADVAWLLFIWCLGVVVHGLMALRRNNE